jgi:hypothetical protein
MSIGMVDKNPIGFDMAVPTTENRDSDNTVRYDNCLQVAPIHFEAIMAKEHKMLV